MATIALYASKINNMPSLIEDVKSSVNNFKQELTSLKNQCLKIDNSICNMDDIISIVTASTKIQEQKVTFLVNFSEDVEQYAMDVVRIDDNVADMVTKNKEEFYNAYHYLKPDCEKSGWEKFCDGCKSVVDWCKDNWESICNIALAVIAVIATVALCVVTFGAAAVVLAAIVGAVVSLAGQLISDVISWAKTGQWTGRWQSYVGSLFGGIAGGVLMLTGNFAAACGAEAAISTLLGESLEGVTGGEKRSMAEIWMDTTISAGTAIVFSKIFGKLTDKLSKGLHNNIPALSRLAGRGSFDASFRMVTTKLKNGTIKNFTTKSIRNGVIGGFAGGVIGNIADGFGLNDFISNGIKGGFAGNESTLDSKRIIMPQFKPIPQINFEPISSY